MGDKTAKGACIAIFCLISSAFYIASIVVAVQDGDDSCQGEDKTMSLKTWLLVTGIVGLCANVVMGLTLAGVIVWEVEECFICTAALSISVALFTIAWFIIGIVIISRSHGQCVAQSTSLGVMAMIMIVLQGLGVCCGGGGSSAANQ